MIDRVLKEKGSVCSLFLLLLLGIAISADHGLSRKKFLEKIFYIYYDWGRAKQTHKHFNERNQCDPHF